MFDERDPLHLRVGEWLYWRLGGHSVPTGLIIGCVTMPLALPSLAWRLLCWLWRTSRDAVLYGPICRRVRWRP